MKELSPVTPFAVDYENLQKEIIKAMKLFYEQFVAEKLVLNVGDLLEYAISVGRVHYKDDGFYGQFNSRTSKILKDMGAKWNDKKKGWIIPLEKLSSTLLSTISQSDARNDAKINELLAALEKADSQKSQDVFDKSEAIRKNLENFDRDINKTVDQIPTVKITLDEKQKEQFRKKYSENMKLNIKGWADDEIIRLREFIQKRTEKGIRYEGIVEEIARDFSVSVKKAKFLAKQETHLLLAEVKVQKYTGAGINRYRWKTRSLPVGHQKGNVRPSHAALNNKIFDWAHPPIVDGRPVHPGQDFNCRCIAIPLWEE